MRRSAAWIGLALLALGVVLVVRAARLTSRQLEAEPAPRVDIDCAALARRLAEGPGDAVRFYRRPIRRSAGGGQPPSR